VSLEVLHEDNHLLIVRKPPGVPSQPDASGAPSLWDLACAHRVRTEGKPGAAYVGLVHRLDRNVGGVVALARTSKAAARLSEQFRQGTVRKTYRAAVIGAAALPPGEQTWVDWLRKHADTNLVAAGPERPDSKRAETIAVPQAWNRGAGLLLLHPRTGRPHQLRVQCATRGMPIMGDRKYGSQRPFDGMLALHALALEFQHPTRGETLRVACPPPAHWRRLAPELADALAAFG
jgi:23S rRNA pseudouridine1911/1915/1917 synthase